MHPEKWLPPSSKRKVFWGLGPSAVWPLIPALNILCEAAVLGWWGPSWNKEVRSLGRKIHGDKTAEWKDGKMVLRDILGSFHQTGN